MQAGGSRSHPIEGGETGNLKERDGELFVYIGFNGFYAWRFPDLFLFARRAFGADAANWIGGRRFVWYTESSRYQLHDSSYAFVSASV